jgi:hypothetical protein
MASTMIIVPSVCSSLVLGVSMELPFHVLLMLSVNPKILIIPNEQTFIVNHECCMNEIDVFYVRLQKY